MLNDAEYVDVYVDHKKEKTPPDRSGLSVMHLDPQYARILKGVRNDTSMDRWTCHDKYCSKAAKTYVTISHGHKTRVTHSCQCCVSRSHS